MKSSKGFTLVELIAGIVILGILVASSGICLKQIVQAIGYDSDLSKAVYLSQLEFSIVNSISYTDTTLANNYNNLNTNYNSSGYSLRRAVVYQLGNDASAVSVKRIDVTVYRSGSSTSILSTRTYRTKNVTFGP